MVKILPYDPEFDALVGYSAEDRMRAMVGGAFEGADRFNRDLLSWTPGLQPPDAEYLPYRDLAISRSRDVNRNDAYVNSGIQLRQDSVVGAMFMLNAKPKVSVLGLDETWAEEFQEEAETKFTLTAESEQHWLDAARLNTLTSMVRLAIGIDAIGGEILATVEWLRDLPRPCNTAIQMIDADRLSTPWGRIESPELRGGVERNRYGAPQAYHFRLAHPYDYGSMEAYRWKRVPVRKPWGRLQVIHIFEQNRPDQTRGISAMVSALKEMKITKKYRDIVLQSAVLNATYAATIESELPPEAAYAQLGGGNLNALEQYASAYLSAIAAYAGDKRAFMMNGVRIPHLYPGTRLQLRPAGTPGGVGSEFEQSLLRYIAANLGVSYEQLSKDYSQTNYSSARAAMNETRKYMASRKKFVADRFASIVYALWLEEMINKGEITSMPARPDGWWYEPLMMEALTSCDWIGASAGQIDELKETQAAVLRLKNNLSTVEIEAGRLGVDWRALYVQREREMREEEERDIAPPEKDNMINAASGTPSDTGDSPRGEGDERRSEREESDRTDDLIAAVNDLNVSLEQNNAHTNRQLAKAVEALAFKDPEPPVVHVHSQPQITVDVHTKQNGKTKTRVLARDEKGGILETETIPEEDDNG